ncbi:processed acidic surface protein [Bacillus sp. 1P06AnD]|uniref:processed acidic surface protein n=1 Tax=Bacillus sp. 1P06AnD TaxID=3132208 RepID=UPI0039A2E3B0
MKYLITALLTVTLLFGGSFTASAAVETKDLDAYLAEVNLSKEQLDDYLLSFDLTLEDFEDIEDLRDTLGPRVTTEALDQLLKDYDMTREELEGLLAEYGELEEGKSIEESFLFISDIEDIIVMDSYPEYEDMEDLFGELEGIFSELGITEDEIMKLAEHMDKIQNEDSALEDKLMALSEKMMAFEDFETVDELSPSQMAQMMAVLDEFKQILQLDFKFYLVKNGNKAPISFESLMKLEDAKGAGLLIEIYNNEGKLLLDMILTGDMIGSDLIHETGDAIQQTANHALKTPAVHKPLTVKGGKLPNTAGNYMGGLLAGVGLLAISFLALRKVKVAK